jgi:hypothetical protein
MSVAFDTFKTVNGTNVSSLTTAAFTITSAANRVAVCGLELDLSAISNLAVTVGGASGIVVPGAFNIATGNVHTWYAIAPATGSQTAAFTWTGGSVVNAAAGVATYYGVNQSEPVYNGTTTGLLSSPATSSVTMQSALGDMTVDHCYTDHGAANTPTQTQSWLIQNGTQTAGAGSNSSRGPGTGGSFTHTWTITAGACNHVIQDGFTLRAALPPASVNLLYMMS